MSSSNTMWPLARAEAYPHAKFYFDPSNRLATYTPTSQTGEIDRTGQTDNGLIAEGEPFYKRSPKNL